MTLFPIAGYFRRKAMISANIAPSIARPQP
jgi:hypothetical protein